MIMVRFFHPLRYDHFDIPAGTIIAVPAGIAHTAIQRGIAEMAEPEKAIVEPQETRVLNRPRGRPRMNMGPQ